jgi:hypothetical protein
MFFVGDEKIQHMVKKNITKIIRVLFSFSFFMVIFFTIFIINIFKITYFNNIFSLGTVFALLLDEQQKRKEGSECSKKRKDYLSMESG